MRNLFLAAVAMLAAISVQAQCVQGNCFEGAGTFRFPNGDEFNGLWRQGIPNGYGVYTFINGDQYKGNMKAGLMDGRGTYSYANGDRYVGMWKAGLMEGRGHFYWFVPGDLMDIAKYEGYWKAGVAQQFTVAPPQKPAEPPVHK